MTVILPPVRSLDQVIAGSAPRLVRVTRVGDALALPAVTGSVSIDAGADVRRTARVSVAASLEWVPDGPTHPLDVRSGSEWLVELGVVDDSAAEHWWDAGVYGIASVSVSDDDGGQSVELDLADRAYRAKLASSERRWAIGADEYVLGSIARILGQAMPWMPLDIDTGGDLLAGGSGIILAEWGGDLWSACRKVALSLQRDLHFDASGVCVAPRVTDILTVTAAPLPGLVSQSLTVDAADIINVTGVPWEEARPDDAATDWQPQGGVESVADTSSTTGIGSPLGRRPRLADIDLSVIHTPAHALLAASAVQSIRTGLLRAASGSCVPDPRLDVGQAYLIDGAAHVVSRLEVDLAGSATRVDFGAARPELAAQLAATMAPAREYQTTEIVTGLAPLRCRLTTEPLGAEVAVEWTDALAGVEVGDPITVLHKGSGRRIAVALLVKKPLAKTNPGEKVATFAGADLDVGDTVTVRAKVGSGSYGTATSSGGTVSIDIPAAATGLDWSYISQTGNIPASMGDAGSATVTAINDNRHAINALISVIAYINGRLVNLDANN